MQELDGGTLLEAAVAAPRLENLPHATASDTATELPGADLQDARRNVLCGVLRGRLGGLGEEAPHGCGRAEQALQLRTQLGLVLIVVLQSVFALLERQVEQAIQLSIETGRWLSGRILHGGPCRNCPHDTGDMACCPHRWQELRSASDQGSTDSKPDFIEDILR